LLWKPPVYFGVGVSPHQSKPEVSKGGGLSPPKQRFPFFFDLGQKKCKFKY